MFLLFSIREVIDLLFGKELYIRFTVRVFVNVYRFFVCVLLSLFWFRGWDVGFDCIKVFPIWFPIPC